MKKKIVLVITLVAIAVGISAFKFCKTDVDIEKSYGPLSQLVDKDNRPVEFNAFKGKVVVINNWASWCPPCIAEMPSIQKLKAELKSDDIVFVMVSFDEETDKPKRFMEKRGYDLDVYFPGRNYPYATTSIPVTLVLDKKGTVVMRHEGMLDYSDSMFKKELRRMLTN